jgi:serine phosphatase RsbU (regulator of sigma subunit)
VDVFQANGLFGVAWGDLSGNGPAVGPLVTASKALLRATVLSHPAAGATAHRLSRILYHVFYEERSLAMVFATYEPEQRKLVLCNCGGWPPILLSGGRARPLGEMEPRLGDYDIWRYAPVAVTLSPGDTLVGFTAGLPESRREGEILGTAPLRVVLERRQEAELPALVHDVLQLACGDSRDPPPSTVVALRAV